MHVDGEPRDALVLRSLRVRAGKQHAEVGVLPSRRPHLLAVDDELVAVAFGPRREPREVGSRSGLAEQLAPGLLAGDDVLHIAVDLFLRTVRGDRGRGEQQAETGGRAERAEARYLALHAHDVVA